MAKKYLDYDGLLYFWQKLKTAFSTKAEGVKTITRSGTTFTVTRADDTTFTFTQQDNTVAKTTTTPKMNGTAAIGSETKYAAGDHVHPTDTSRAPLASPALTGTPTAPTAAAITDNTQIATTAFVHDVVDALDTGVSDVQIGTTSIVTDGVATIPESGASTTGLMTGAQYTKLNGIAAGAEVNQNAFSTISVKEYASATTTVSIGADSKTDTLSIIAGNNMSITANSTDDSITLSPVFLIAGENNDGLMSSAQASKLAGIAAGAEVNQNAFSNVKVGSTTVAADSKTDTLELAAGTNISLTPDATNDKVTIAFSGTIPTLKNVFGKVKVGSTTIEADTPQDTLELAAGSNVTLTPDATNDKVTIAASHPTYTSFTGKPTANQTPGFGSTFTISQISQSTTGQVSGTDRTVKIPDAVATTSANGLMSSADKTKLDDISGSTLDIVAGTNVTITPDTTNGNLTIASTDTKTTAGSGDSSSKLFIVGTTSQSSSGVTTYSQDTAYVGTDGHLYSNSKQAVNLSDSQALTNKTYNGYTLKAACAKGVVTSISADSTDLPTVTAVKNYVTTAVTGAAAFQGTAPTTFAPTNYKAGWYWVIGTAGTYAGQVCEPGDMIFATKDYATAYAAADFDVIQTNLDITSITNAEIDTIVAA